MVGMSAPLFVLQFYKKKDRERIEIYYIEEK